MDNFLFYGQHWTQRVNTFWKLEFEIYNKHSSKLEKLRETFWPHFRRELVFWNLLNNVTLWKGESQIRRETCKSTAGGMCMIGCIGHVTNVLNVGSVCSKHGKSCTNCTDCVYILYNSTECTHEHLLPKTGLPRA